MNRHTVRPLLAAWMLVPALPLSAEAMAAGATEELQELDEVLVRGFKTKPNRDPQFIVDWLKRLVGQYRYQGYVDVRAEGAPRGRQAVQGVSECIPFGLAPSVQCSINVVWPEVQGEDGAEVPGGVSNLSPAMIMYGLDPDHLGIHYLQVDSKGFTTSALGYLDGNTLNTTAPCADIPGKCERVTRIEAQPDGKVIHMQIDINNEYTRVVRYNFALLRQSGGWSGETIGGPSR